MKKANIINITKAIVAVTFAMTIAFVSSINIAYAPSMDEAYLAPITADAQETPEIVSRALECGEGYEFVEFTNITENEVTYIVQDNSNGFLYQIAYCEDANGNPVSNIVVYSAS